MQLRVFPLQPQHFSFFAEKAMICMAGRNNVAFLIFHLVFQSKPHAIVFFCADCYENSITERRALLYLQSTPMTGEAMPSSSSFA